MHKQQLLSLVQEIEQEIQNLDVKHPTLLDTITDQLQLCRSKLHQHHHDVVEEIDEFLELLTECDVDGVLEIDEIFSLVDQLHDLLEDIRSQAITQRGTSRILLLETKGLLQSFSNN